jgi:hypothetical protein
MNQGYDTTGIRRLAELDAQRVLSRYDEFPDDECCAPEMREIKGVWVPSHAPSCTRGSLEGFVMAEGEFMDEFGKAGNDH